MGADGQTRYCMGRGRHIPHCQSIHLTEAQPAALHGCSGPRAHSVLLLWEGCWRVGAQAGLGLLGCDLQHRTMCNSSRITSAVPAPHLQHGHTAPLTSPGERLQGEAAAETDDLVAVWTQTRLGMAQTLHPAGPCWPRAPAQAPGVRFCWEPLALATGPRQLLQAVQETGGGSSPAGWPGSATWDWNGGSGF